MELLFIILSVTLKIVTSQVPSPCPETFSYESKTMENDRWYGSIILRTSVDVTGVQLHVFLDRPAIILGNWFGEAFSTDNKEYIIRNGEYKLEAGSSVSIRFFVKYDFSEPKPTVVRIVFNGKTICTTQTQQVIKPSAAILYISRFQQSSSSNNQNNRPLETPQSTIRRPNSDKEMSTSRPFEASGTKLSPIQSIPTSISRPISPTSSCGVVATKAEPLITHSQATSPGQWPWHAALYLSERTQLTYICGATLITEQHVLTAAHCGTKAHTDIPLNPSSLLVYLGKYSLITFGPEVQERSVSDIFVHPEYNSSIFFNDIAVFKLSTPVKRTNFVVPCCIWEGDSSLENIQSDLGTVVGWGFNENGQLSNNLMQAKMPIISTISCIYSNRDFFSRFTFEKNFCAGFRNDTSVCNGDSGGAMVFPRKGTTGQNTVWQIRGLVSVGVPSQGRCDPSQYTLFTDVAKYTDWIRQVVTK